jgi:hypothetical protein
MTDPVTSPRTPSRDDNETTTHPRQRTCPICATRFTPVRRQLYDTNACRQIAYRRRAATTTQPPAVPAGRRRDSTIYHCTECDPRYLGEQWCPDCNRPCRRLGTGGECDCGELLTINELLGGAPMA